MPNKSHLLFRNPVEGVVSYQPLRRAVFQVEDDAPKDYTRMQEYFTEYQRRFFQQREDRHAGRTIDVPQHIDYIQIHFFGPFDYERFANRYRSNFGLVPVKFEKFNTVGLFAITNETAFADFHRQLQIFIDTEDHTNELPYNVDIRYIKEFYLLTNERIKAFDALYNVAYLNLVESEEILQEIILPLEDRLQEYLRDGGLRFDFNPINRTIQIWDISPEVMETVISNFDIVHTVNSSLAGIIRPGAFGTPIREFGFTVIPPPEDAPSIGILDTGVSNQTPLAALLLNRNDEEYDLVGSGSLVDNHDMLRGHGTGVSCFAALGNQLIPEHRGAKQADAWIVSIKIFQDGRPRVSDTRILEAIRQVHGEKGTRIFVLTISDKEPKRTDDYVSPFAYSLDRLAHDLDILIIIAAGNVEQEYFFDPASGAPLHHYPNDFTREFANIKSPAESMNNLTVGASAGNFEEGVTNGIALDKNFPAIYTSKFHYNFYDGILKSTQKNKYLKKPDVLFHGGDWDNTTGSPEITGLKYLSARPGEYYGKNVGTSYSAPLLANLAAKILSVYPGLRMQTVKALIINSAATSEFPNHYKSIPNSITSHIVGYGIPSIQECLYSDTNSVTMILEDEITPDRIKSYELNVPDYLLTKENKTTVLEANITLCYSFEPVLNNQMAYCPVHIGFGLFQNLPLTGTNKIVTEDGEEKEIQVGLNGNTTKNIQIKAGQSWSEDYYFKMKLLSNVQKIKLVFNKDDILNNENKFKLAVNCLRHKLLSLAQRDHYSTAHWFSLAINFKEKPLQGILAGDLYSELEVINTLEAIADLEAEAES